ncbi:MAG: type II toxin-antitoxin system Phd/YefM family antitoxin [Coleofasciculus sp. D1-CHI-01]|uniref:type II toxin-antitoxin system Phd/YefM family antitoxin n=1 Tax=Coleofasciculus sp. D1-CHI-01 TaxID=3068482 RepID=UPI003302C78C
MTLVKITDTTSQLSELVKRVNSERELIILTTDGQAKAVLLGLEAFEDLLGMREYSQLELVPLHDFQQQFKQALIEAGYDSRDKIVNLVQDVKREMAAERQDY